MIKTFPASIITQTMYKLMHSARAYKMLLEITTVHAHQHGNRGRSELNFNGAIILLARENPLLYNNTIQ